MMEQLENMSEAAEAVVTEIREVQEDLPNDVEKAALASQNSGSIGKFKDTESLLSAYNNLQSEFTRKCQRLAEFESAAKALEGRLSFADNAEVLEYVKANNDLQTELLTAYLSANIQPAPAVIANRVGSGIPLSAPPKPTTLAEAKAIAKTLL